MEWIISKKRRQITTPFMGVNLYKLLRLYGANLRGKFGENLGKKWGKIIGYYVKFSEHIRTIKNTGRLDDYYVYIAIT